MRTKLVTSYYAYHQGPPIWGQMSRERWYKYSIACLCKMGTEVVCYTDEGDLGYNQLLEVKQKFNLDNLVIKIYRMLDNPYQARVYNVRMKFPEVYNDPNIYHQYFRSPQMYWIKYLFLEKEYEPNIYLYWIDGGLSHTGMFPPKCTTYSEEADYSTYYANSITGYSENEYKLYCFDKAFTVESINRINEFAEDKIIHLYRQHTTDNDNSLFNNKINTDIEYEGLYPVGGFFGGNSINMLNYISAFKNTVERVLASEDFICGDQEIMAYLNAYNRSWFKNWRFETFCHEGWGPEVFKDGAIPFYDFFYKELQ